MNCPGLQAGAGADSLAKSSSSVRVSAVSLRFLRTRKGAVNIGSARDISIKIEELKTCGLQALHEDPCKTFHEIVSHGGISFAFASQTLAIKVDRPHLFERTHIELPLVGREEP